MSEKDAERNTTPSDLTRSFQKSSEPENREELERQYTDEQGSERLPTASIIHPKAEPVQAQSNGNPWWLPYAALFVSAISAGFSGLQFKNAAESAIAAKRSADTASRSLAIGHRAYLRVRAPENKVGWGLLNLPLENYGRVPCNHIKLKIRYEILDKTKLMSPGGTSKQALVDERVVSDIASDDVLLPGSEGGISVMLPHLTAEVIEAVKRGESIVLVRGEAEYDTGFESTDRMKFCANYTSRAGKWQLCGGGGFSIDLGESKPVK